MELTCGTGIICPGCKKEIQVETKGIFGGIIQQMIVGSVFDRIKREGAKITHYSCGTVFHVKGDGK